MPVTPVIAMGGLRKLQADLRKGIPEAAVEARLIVKQAMEPMLLVAHAQADKHRQSGELGAAWSARVSGARGSLVNPLPQASPLEFGGTIAPRGTPISLPKLGMVYGPEGALTQAKQAVERNLLRGFDVLSRRINFH